MKKYLGHDPWLVVLLIIILNAIYSPFYSMAQSGLGASSVGRGGISLGSLDPLWALWNDLSGLKLPPNVHTDSLLTHDRGSSSRTKAQNQWYWQGLALMVQRSYGLAELDERLMSTVWVAAADSNQPSKAWGIGVYDTGDALFRTSRLRLGWAKSTPQWSVGLATELHRLSFGGSYAPLVSISVDVAARYRLFKHHWLIMSVENAGASKLREAQALGNSVASLPSRIRIAWHSKYALQYPIRQWVEASWEVSYEPQLRYGAEWALLQAHDLGLHLRFGMASSPFTPHLGFGLERRGWSVQMAMNVHPILGWSPVMDLRIGGS